MAALKIINYQNAIKEIDPMVVEFWLKNGYSIKEKKYSKFAATSSINWYGFIERVNECIDNPTWDEIRGFVGYYCRSRNEECLSYLQLYQEMEKNNYSPSMDRNKLDKQIYGIKMHSLAKTIFDFYETHYPNKIKK